MAAPGSELVLDVVEGIHCAGCVRRLEKTMADAPGVADLRVDLMSRSARMRLDGAGLDPAGVIARLAVAGFDARPAAPLAGPASDAGADTRARQARLDAVVAAALAAACMSWAMLVHVPSSPWIQAGLATLALAWPGRGVLLRGARSALRLAGDMDVLVSLGAAAAWGHGVAGLALGWHHLHFESAAMIVAFTLVGRALEARARAATGAAVAALLARQPPRATLVLPDGGERQVDASALRPGDRVRIRPGEAVPADGRVAEGSGEIDEASFSGEPLPVAKQAGDTVLAGSVNRLGSLLVAVEAAGAATQLARAVAAMHAAQAAKAPIARVADRVAAVFVPVAIVLSALTWAGWWWFGGPEGWRQGIIAAIDVLVIACPCALGLATPAAIAAAVGRAARIGVLVRDGAALEVLAGCRIVALDKTGTITRGVPVLAGVVCAPGADRDTVLRLASAAEAGSEHPVGRCIRAAAPDVAAGTGFAAEPGGGVRAEVEGGEVLVGTGEWLARRGIAVPGDLLPGPGTIAHVAAAGKWVGSIRCSDELRPESIGAVAELRQLGLRPIILTGDRPEEANRVGRALAVGDVTARCTPAGKAALVGRYEAAGDRVLAIGDGVNDAAMLARASCGAAVGGGSDVAALAGGLVLDGRHPLVAAAESVRLARATMRVVRQNLVAAAVYNLVAIPVAAGALTLAGVPLLPPAWAAGAMAASSLCVVLNSLRLARWR